MSSRRSLHSVAIVVVLLLAGCFGRSPTTEFYSLRALSAEKVGATNAQGISLRIGPANLPRYLDRPQIARRISESHISYDEFSRWAGGLDSELLRVVGANLSALLKTERVVVYPAEAPFRVAYRVTLDVERFEAGPKNSLTLRSRWVIRPGGAGDPLVVARTDLDQPTKLGDIEDVASAHSAAADALSRAIARRLLTLMTAESESGPES